MYQGTIQLNNINERTNVGPDALEGLLRQTVRNEAKARETFKVQSRDYGGFGTATSRMRVVDINLHATRSMYNHRSQSISF